MEQLVNRVYKPLFERPPGIRYVILMGGRGAGRSTVVSQFANAALVAINYFRCAIMRYILGDIRNSIYREITDRATENGIIEKLRVNDSTMSISYGANVINAHGFKKSSGEQTAKLKSLANYTTVIIEEADEVDEEDFMQLDDSIRTIKGDILIILLLNPPPKSHWIIKRWFNLIPVPEAPGFYMPQLKPEIHNTLFIHTTYKDNIQNIDPATQDRYEGYAVSKPEHFWRQIRGLVPEVVTGRIYSGWKKVSREIPHEAKLVAHWLDFGYTNDPTAIGSVYKHNGGFILKEHVYSRGLKNPQIAAILAGLPPAPIIADSSEPKSIDEIKDTEPNLVVIPASKGPDSVRFGIQKVQALPISYTEDSRNIEIEQETYQWLEDKEGNVLNIPKPKQKDHHMDGIRYVLDWYVEDDDTAVDDISQYIDDSPMYPQIGI